VQQEENRLGDTMDYAQRLRTYSQNVREILVPERLAKAAMNLVRDTLGVQRGALLISDTNDDMWNVRFQFAGGIGVKSVAPMAFRAFSPLMVALRQNGVPLTSSTLSSDPSFEAVREQEREWLQELEMELFVPILARGQLVGILALGAKGTGAPYSDQELEFLSELADQSGFPLETARLFSHMRTLNSVLNHLYTDREMVNRRLQEMDRLKSAFISIVTHELRSPLVGIDLSLQVLQRQGLDQLPSQQREPIQDIVKGFDQLKAMIDKLVNFSTFLSKQGELHKEEIDFVATLREAVEPLEVMAQFRNIEIEIRLPDELPPVWADKERISEAIYHLVHNAIKFNHPQGRVSISCAADEATVSLSVTDTGIGIDADKLETIWNGFSQAADALRRGVEGLGLGLALVKHIINAHGGKVWADSQAGQGSTFGFRIPIGKPVGPTEEEISLLMPDREQSWGI
jgi:signal transduction histidine kinase